MIEVYNTIIDERELIGVGPVWAKRSTDPIQLQLWNERQFYFEMYTRAGGRVVITTDLLSFKEPHTESSKLAQTAIIEAHKAVRRCLTSGCFTEMLIVTHHPDEFPGP
jgi:hypothetical protein